MDSETGKKGILVLKHRKQKKVVGTYREFKSVIGSTRAASVVFQSSV